MQSRNGRVAKQQIRYLDIGNNSLRLSASEAHAAALGKPKCWPGRGPSFIPTGLRLLLPLLHYLFEPQQRARQIQRCNDICQDMEASRWKRLSCCLFLSSLSPCVCSEGVEHVYRPASAAQQHSSQRTRQKSTSNHQSGARRRPSQPFSQEMRKPVGKAARSEQGNTKEIYGKREKTDEERISIFVGLNLHILSFPVVAVGLDTQLTVVVCTSLPEWACEGFL